MHSRDCFFLLHLHITLTWILHSSANLEMKADWGDWEYLNEPMSPVWMLNLFQWASKWLTKPKSTYRLGSFGPFKYSKSPKSAFEVCWYESTLFFIDFLALQILRLLLTHRLHLWCRPYQNYRSAMWIVHAWLTNFCPMTAFCLVNLLFVYHWTLLFIIYSLYQQCAPALLPTTTWLTTSPPMCSKSFILFPFSLCACDLAYTVIHHPMNTQSWPVLPWLSPVQNITNQD